MRPVNFKLHFNRIAMQRKDPNVWSVQTSRGCFHAQVVKCDVPLETIFNPVSRQPRAFLKGRGYGFWVELVTGQRFLWITNSVPDGVNQRFVKNTMKAKTAEEAFGS